MTLLDIGEVRSRTGLPASTLHHYEALGLIRSAGRSGLRRQYEEDTVERLAAIVRCRRAGFTLHEIATLLATGDQDSWQDLVRGKRDEVRAQIRELRRVERRLTRALGCPSAAVLQCEHFQVELRAAVPVGATSGRTVRTGSVPRG